MTTNRQPERIKAWYRPFDWKPKTPCEECEGDGMGPNRTYNRDALIDWDDCHRCGGTGEEPTK